MSVTATQIATTGLSTLTLRPESPEKDQGGAAPVKAPGEDYKYARFLPTFDQSFKLPPLQPFEHVDPGHAALSHHNPKEFLEGGKEKKLTPKFGSEIKGVQLSKLDARGKRWGLPPDDG
jgi:sulfonate dioxygenase